MTKLSDQELIEELLYRFAEKRRMLNEQQRLTDELQDVNQKLGVSEALKSHFLSNIRNEINNPLTSILGLATNLSSMKNADADKIHNIGHLIHGEAFSLNFQLKNIFCAADIEAGEAYPVYNKTDVYQIAHSVVDSFSHLIKKKNIAVSVTPQEEHIYFFTDGDKFSLIISNLISNAIEYSESNSDINVIINNQEELLEVKIVDNGIGISQENFGIIFNRFTQLETGTTKSHLGQGLGLSITKALLDLMNAKIDLESTPNSGSTFTVSIPRPLESEISSSLSEEDNEFLFDADESF